MQISCEQDAAASPKRKHLDNWSLVVAANEDRVLTETLLSSPAIDERCQVITKRGFSSAAAAYNSGLLDARHEIVAFAHQDVYLPETWLEQVENALAYLAQHDPEWGVLGVFGALSRTHIRAGYCYSTGLRKILGEPFHLPAIAESLDELLLIVRKSSGLRFDDHLPGFHLYGTDMCLLAEFKDMNSYVIPAFCIHNSNGIKYYPASYWRSYRYMRSKWWQRLPVTTSCVTLTKSSVPMLRKRGSDICRRLLLSPPPVGSRCHNVAELYREISPSIEGRTLDEI